MTVDSAPPVSLLDLFSALAARRCAPSAGGLPECGPCPAGYEGSGDALCTDVDGCKPNPCFQDAGAPGLRAECEDVPAGCFADPPVASTSCPPSPSEFTCGPCPVGYRGDGVSCSECEISVAVTAATTDSTGGILKRSLDLTVVAALAPFAEGCNTTGGVQYTWTLVSATDPLFSLPGGVKTRTRNLFVPALTLPEGSYSATLRACLSGNGGVCSITGAVYITVVPSPLSGFIGGGGVSTAESNAVTFDR